MTAYSESGRQWVHVGSGAFAFLLRYLTWTEAAAMAAVAIVFNVFVLPRIGGHRLNRPADSARGYPLGIVCYPLAVLLLILLLPERPDIAAAAWGVLAFGDGGATLIGRRWGTAPWPWNRQKTIAGTIGFVVCGTAGALALAWWTAPSIAPRPGLAFIFLAPAAAAIVAALVETMPVRLDDNLSVPFVAAAVLWLASLMTLDALSRSWPGVASALPWAVSANLLVAWAGDRARTVSRSGAVVGAVIGIVIYAFAGAGAWLLLIATFVIATIASRLGLKRKMLLGIAEERGGRRGAGNALANCGVAVAAALLAGATPYREPALLALAASLAASGSDTVASEIGKAWGRATFLMTSLGRVPPGTPGAMSLEGTAAGIVSAFALAVLAAWLGLIPSSMTLIVVVAATAGALAESALAATLEGPGILNNDMLNFINSAVAAAVGLALT